MRCIGPTRNHRQTRRTRPDGGVGGSGVGGMRSARRRASRSAAATIAAWAVFAVCGGVTADGAAGLTTPVTGSWKGVSLRALGERLAGATGVAVVIDRRIDGATPLSLDAEGMPAVELLRLAASEARCGLALVRSGARFVPSHLVAMIEAGDREAARAEAEAPRAAGRVSGYRPRTTVCRACQAAGGTDWATCSDATRRAGGGAFRLHCA